MQIITLPNVLLGAAMPADRDALLYYHVGHAATYRSRITFERHCLTLLLSGTKRVFAEASSVVYDASSCLLCRAGHYLSNEISAAEEPYHSILLFFSDAALRGLKHAHRDALAAAPRAAAPTHPLALPTDAYVEAFKRSIREALESDGLPPALHRIKFDEIMLYLAHKHGRHVIKYFETPLEQDHVRFFRSVVEAHAGDDLSVDELAFLCHMSMSTFKRRFAEVYDESPGRWLRDQRLERAAELLSVHRKNPSDIYEEAGFSSLSSFIYSFRQKFGTTPKQYQLGSTGSE